MKKSEVVVDTEGGANAFQFDIDFRAAAAIGFVFVEVMLVANVEVEAQFGNFLEMELATDKDAESVDFILVVDQIAIELELPDAALAPM